MSPRRVAILGFGHVAEHGHLPAWLRRDDFRIVAVADVDATRRARAAELLPGARIHDDSGVLLARESVEVVDICTPPALHAPLAALAARAGCHVVCEKPLATSTAELAPVVRAAAEAGVALYTVHNWKHSEQFLHVAALAAERPLGSLRHVRIETVRSGRAVTVGPDWRGNARLAGGGILLDHGWHALYLLLALAAEAPSSVRAETNRLRYTGSDVEDTARCWIQFPSVTGEIHLTWAGAERHTRWVLECTGGRLILEDDRGEMRNGGSHRALRFSGSLSAGSHHPDWFNAVIDGFAVEIADAARRDANLAEAIRVLELTELAYASAARGGETLAVPPRSNGGVPASPRRTAVILPPSPVSFRRLAGLPLVRRTALAALRAGFENVVALGGDHAERLRNTLAADPRTRSIPIESNGTEGSPSNVPAGIAAFIPSDCLVTTEALRRVSRAVLDGRPLVFRSDVEGPGILLTRQGRAGESLAACEPLPVCLEEGLCVRISDERSAEAAEKRLLDQLRQATFSTDGPLARLDRSLSLRLSRLLVRTPLRPNLITVIGTAVGLSGAWLFTHGTYPAALVGSLLFWLAVILDGCDGEVARLKFQETRFGHLFDIATDNLVHVAVFAGLGIGEVRQNPDFPVAWLIGLLLGGFACACLATYFCLLRVPAELTTEPRSPRERLRRRLLGGFELLMNRDFAYLLVLLALIDRLAWFLWAAAFGTWVYAAGLASVHAWRKAD
jgi:predicted dehydrogenase/phosphatidylglycerophosphate synthase